MHRIAPGLFGLAFAMTVFAGPDDTVWTQLFNGTDLEDWDVKIMGYPLNQDPKNTWRVANGTIEVNYSNLADWSGEPWSHAEYKVRPWSYYLLEAEYQFYGAQVPGSPKYANENSGIMIHAQKLSTMAVNQNWPISLENQLLGPKSEEGVGSANLCTPGTAVHNAEGTLNNNHCIRAAANERTVAPLWTRSETLVLGDSLIRHYIEGKPVLTYYKPVQYEGIVTGNTVKIVNNAPLASGYIQLQSESAPIRFRNIRLANLSGCMTKGSPNYKSYFVKHDPAACNAVPVRPDGRSGSGRMDFDAVGRRLVVERPGAYRVEVRDLSGSLIWERQGWDRQEFDLGGAASRGLYQMIVKQAGARPLRRLVFLP